MAAGLNLLLALAMSSLGTLWFLFWTAAKVDQAYEELRLLGTLERAKSTRN